MKPFYVKMPIGGVFKRFVLHDVRMGSECCVAVLHDCETGRVLLDNLHELTFDGWVHDPVRGGYV